MNIKRYKKQQKFNYLKDTFFKLITNGNKIETFNGELDTTKFNKNACEAAEAISLFSLVFLCVPYIGWFIFGRSAIANLPFVCHILFALYCVGFVSWPIILLVYNYTHKIDYRRDSYNALVLFPVNICYLLAIMRRLIIQSFYFKQQNKVFYSNNSEAKIEIYKLYTNEKYSNLISDIDLKLKKIENILYSLRHTQFNNHELTLKITDKLKVQRQQLTKIKNDILAKKQEFETGINTDLKELKASIDFKNLLLAADFVAETEVYIQNINQQVKAIEQKSYSSMESNLELHNNTKVLLNSLDEIKEII
jgi:hypothetical protein